MHVAAHLCRVVITIIHTSEMCAGSAALTELQVLMYSKVAANCLFKTNLVS